MGGGRVPAVGAAEPLAAVALFVGLTTTVEKGAAFVRGNRSGAGRPQRVAFSRLRGPLWVEAV